ncbi:MAG: polysaccharide biosynthesis protein [Alphaproteobacteria bacterium]|nr:polysaccharide biosynthesis protein [Alphaproteobacteria bacterium]
MHVLDGKRVLITGGTGSLGKVLLRRLLGGGAGDPAKIIVLSRDEAKQHAIRVEYQRRSSPTDEVIYDNSSKKLEFRIGDVRDFHSVASALREADVVFNAAALKQVPTCEYFPFEAVQTNVGGAENIVRAIRDLRLDVETVVGISTDKAVAPINVMGMTKSLQERILARANLDAPETRFVLVRYGNVLASRGSVIPLFHEQIRNGGPVTITDPRMTRFLLSLEEAVDIILVALREARRGETYIPRAPSAKIVDVAAALIENRPIKTVMSGVRPGEKLHELLISEEECHRAVRRNGYYAIGPILPELQSHDVDTEFLRRPYSSADDVMTPAETHDLLVRRGLMIDHDLQLEGEFLR